MALTKTQTKRREPIARKDVFREGLDIYTPDEFAAKHRVETQSVYYAINNGAVDFIQLGKTYLIVGTTHTMQYKPNDNAERRAKPKKRRPAKRTA